MTPDEQLRAARHEFARRVADVRPADLSRPTPCTDWDVAALVRHVVAVARGYRRLLDGASAAQFIAEDDGYRLGPDPAAEFVAASGDLVAAFTAPGGLERTVHHPMGQLPAAQLLAMCTGEWTVHAWDLARALGGDEALDPDLVAVLHERFAPQRDRLAATGYFAAGPGVADDATLQARLLDVLGR